MALGVIVTIVVGAYSISSRLSLVPGVQPDSRSPLVGYFTLTNDGLTSIYSVSLDYNWPEIESPTFHANGNEVNVTNFEIPELAANQKHYVPVFFPTQAGSPRDVTKAEVLVKITFRPKFLWARQQIFHFAMFKDADGVVHWLPI